MDFIERIFGVSPDGGTGSTELMIVAAVVLLVILVRGRQWVATRHHGWERVVQAFALDIGFMVVSGHTLRSDPVNCAPAIGDNPLVPTRVASRESRP